MSDYLPLSYEVMIITLICCCLLGLIWAILNALWVARVKVQTHTYPQQVDQYNKFEDETAYDPNIHMKVQSILEVAGYIQRGSNAFLFAEYKYIGIFVVAMAFVIFFAVEQQLGYVWTTVAFLLGCMTSVLAGYVGMRVAVFANYRCAYKAMKDMSQAFSVAYRAGCVLGFSLTSLGLLVLVLLIVLYNNYYIKSYYDFASMYDCIAGYGLGGSTIALFGRVGGGIFTKAADVGADLVGKIENDLPEDSPNNPATIADNVGDNVGDIAGMGSDLFGSFAEATCAGLVVASTSPSMYYHPNTILYPLFISAFGIVVCFFTTIFAYGNVHKFDAVTRRLKNQLLISSILLTPTLWFAGYLTLPDRLYGFSSVDRQPIHAWICAMSGLWTGLIIGYITEYYTSHSYSPVRQVAKACETGAATNIIYGLALGNISTIIPITFLAITAFICHHLLGMFGVAIGALGMLSNMAVGLAIDGYGPIADNAGGIAEMCNLGESVREKTDALDAAGNTTAAIGKGFAIGSAALVSLALYGAFITRSSDYMRTVHTLGQVNVNFPIIFSGLLIGAMLPYAFTALCNKSVGKAALEMVKEVRDQLDKNPGIKTGQVKPNYERCIGIATKASLQEMFWPALIVLGVPFVVGVIFGPYAIAGLLPGILVSGASMAISSANAGGAWDNAKKYIEGTGLLVGGDLKKKGSAEHKAAIIGDTVGDPLKDTSGPALNILVKLSAIFSLVFAGFFDKTALMQCWMIPESTGCQ